MAEDNESTCPVPNGILLVVGGKEDKGDKVKTENQKHSDQYLDILKTFLKLTNKEDPAVEVITSGSKESMESFAEYEKAFKELGLSQIGHIHHDKREDVYQGDALERISQADGIYISGGDQLKLTSVYGGTPLLVELKRRYIYDYLVIAGTSAGGMAMSTPMIYAGSKDVQQMTGEIKVTTGLEFLKDVCIDTHFVDRGRFVRISQVIASNPTCIGLGIEEDTAVIIRKGIECEITGSGIVIVIEGFDITDTNVTEFGESQKIFVRDLRVKLLAKGYGYTIPKNNPPHI